MAQKTYKKMFSLISNVENAHSNHNEISFHTLQADRRCSFEWLPFRALGLLLARAGEVVLGETGCPLPLGRLIPDSWCPPWLCWVGEQSQSGSVWVLPQSSPTYPVPTPGPWVCRDCFLGMCSYQGLPPRQPHVPLAAELGGRREGEGNWGELDQTAPP